MTTLTSAWCDIALLLCAACLSADEWPLPPISLPAPLKHPCIAATPAELQRLRDAYAQTGPAHDAAARFVRDADRALASPLSFPPRGGQHNQWYQCEACQTGLKTVDDTHHKCPKCGRVYSGEPYDDVIFGQQHERNISAAHAAAWAYAVTGKKMYAEFAAKILLGYAERYRTYPYHSADGKSGKQASKSGGYLFEQTLNEATAMATRIAPAFDLIFDAISAKEQAKIRSGLILPMLQNIDKHKAGMGNWQTWHNAAMVLGGAMVDDAGWVRKALADPKNGFAYQMKTSVSAEGMWYENSWGYHFYTLNALVLTAEGSRRLGIDVWSHPALRGMFTLPARYTMSDGSLPRFGDDTNSSAMRVGHLMEPAYAAYKDASIAALLSKAPTWESTLAGRVIAAAPPLDLARSEVFRVAGHAILRTRGDAHLSAAMTFGPYGGFHGHFDKLSFVLFAFGKELGVDPGRAASQAYRLPIHTRWYKATISHNAVLVDAASQKPATGKLELFAATETHAAAMARCDAAYPGVAYHRLLCMSPTFVLVYDELAANKERRFDWVYHHRAASVACGEAGRDGELETNFAGAEFLRNIKQGSVDGALRVEFTSPEIITRLTVAGAKSSEVRTGDGPGASVLDRVPLAIITRRGTSTQFAAVLEPYRSGEKPSVQSVEVQRDGETVRIVVESGGGREEIGITGDRKLTWKHGAARLLEAAP